MTDTMGSFTSLLRLALGDRLDPSADTFLDMFAADGVMEFPFAYAGLPERIEGREAMAKHLCSGSFLPFGPSGRSGSRCIATCKAFRGSVSSPGSSRKRSRPIMPCCGILPELARSEERVVVGSDGDKSNAAGADRPTT